MKGGYNIIDLTKSAWSDSDNLITGKIKDVFKKVGNGKPNILHGLDFATGESEYTNDIVVTTTTFNDADNLYNLDLTTFRITIRDNDTITINTI